MARQKGKSSSDDQDRIRGKKNPNILDVRLMHNIRHLRGRRTPEEMARLAGWSNPGYLNQIETGARGCSTSVAVRIAKALDIDPGVLYRKFNKDAPEITRKERKAPAKPRKTKEEKAQTKLRRAAKLLGVNQSRLKNALSEDKPPTPDAPPPETPGGAAGNPGEQS